LRVLVELHRERQPFVNVLFSCALFIVEGADWRAEHTWLRLVGGSARFIFGNIN
jgi:hypothetical protein